MQIMSVYIHEYLPGQKTLFVLSEFDTPPMGNFI
jgi:hypothetical protein